MATVESYTAAKIDERLAPTVVDADVVANELVFTKEDGSTLNIGEVGGGVSKVTAFPGSPTDGDLVVRTDQPGDPLYKFTDGAWELQPRMGAQTVPSAGLKMTADHANQIPPSIFRPVNFDAATHDTNAMFAAGSPSKLTIKTPGTYLIEAALCWRGADANTGRRRILIRINGAGDGFNGTVVADNEVSASADDVGVDGSAVVRLSAGDYIEVVAFQDTPGVSVGFKGNERTHLSATWLGGAGQTVDERGVPAVRVAPSTNLTALAPSGTWVAIPFNSEDYDTDGMHDTTVNTTRLTAKTPGLYKVTGRVNWTTAGVSAPIYLAINRNGSEVAKVNKLPIATDGTGDVIEINTDVMLAAGDYVELLFQQASGGARNVNSPGNNTAFSAELIASGKTVTPVARAYRLATSAQDIPNNAWTSIGFDAETSDNDNIHDTATNNTRFTCKTAGVYSLFGVVHITNNSTGVREARILLNGGSFSNVLASDSRNAVNGDHTIIPISTTVELAVGDYVELQAYQNSGGLLALNVGVNVSHFEMVKVGSPGGGVNGYTPVLPTGFDIAPLLNAAWNDNGLSPRYRKNAEGLVTCEGTIAVGSSGGFAVGSTIFTFPVGSRPTLARREFATVKMNGNSPSSSSIPVRVNTDGTVVIPTGLGIPNLVQYDSISLDSIRFYAG